MREVRQQIRDNWQSLLLLLIGYSLLAWGNVAYTMATQSKIDALQHNICFVVNSGKKNTITQKTFYEQAAARALARSKLETGGQKQIDLDSYRNLSNIAKQYEQSERFRFPGC